MEERSASGKIKKIQFGLNVNTSNWVTSVGSSIKGTDYVVSSIIENKNTFFEYGSFEYEIYVANKDDMQNERFWKRYLKMPDVIEYDFNNEDILI